MLVKPIRMPEVPQFAEFPDPFPTNLRIGQMGRLARLIDKQPEVSAAREQIRTYQDYLDEVYDLVIDEEWEAAEMGLNPLYDSLEEAMAPYNNLLRAAGVAQEEAGAFESIVLLLMSFEEWLASIGEEKPSSQGDSRASEWRREMNSRYRRYIDGLWQEVERALECGDELPRYAVRVNTPEWGYDMRYCNLQDLYDAHCKVTRRDAELNPAQRGAACREYIRRLREGIEEIDPHPFWDCAYDESEG